MVVLRRIERKERILAESNVHFPAKMSPHNDDSHPASELVFPNAMHFESNVLASATAWNNVNNGILTVDILKHVAHELLPSEQKTPGAMDSEMVPFPSRYQRRTLTKS